MSHQPPPAILLPHCSPLSRPLPTVPSLLPSTGLGQVGGVTECDQCRQRWEWRACTDLARCIHRRGDVGRPCLQLGEREVSWAPSSGPMDKAGGERVLTRLSMSSLGRPLPRQLPSAVGPPKMRVAKCLNMRTRRKQALRAGMLVAVLRYTSLVTQQRWLRRGSVWCCHTWTTCVFIISFQGQLERLAQWGWGGGKEDGGKIKALEQMTYNFPDEWSSRSSRNVTGVKVSWLCLFPSKHRSKGGHKTGLEINQMTFYRDLLLV